MCVAIEKSAAQIETQEIKKGLGFNNIGLSFCQCQVISVSLVTMMIACVRASELLRMVKMGTWVRICGIVAGARRRVCVSTFLTLV